MVRTPSFVLIPQDTKNLRAERALSADDERHRFTGNATFSSPATFPKVTRNFMLSTILTLESPHRFTKFAGFDANGDVFGVNDRVGIEPRNTFVGDSLKTLDLRLARSFSIDERTKLEFIAESFNLFNTLNVRFFNTTYGAEDFCPFNPAAAGALRAQRTGKGHLIRRTERPGRSSTRDRCSLPFACRSEWIRDCEIEWHQHAWSTEHRCEKKNLKSDESCILNPRSEICNWTRPLVVPQVQFYQFIAPPPLLCEEGNIPRKPKLPIFELSHYRSSNLKSRISDLRCAFVRFHNVLK